MDTNYKVLMTLMGMEIGGAETHVLELSKVLSQRGVEVLVASNGGAYEKELKEWGIEHIKAPMHNKSLFNLISSYRILGKVIEENDIKLVHAHARIPAFICALLKLRYNFRFVTTAHWIFNTIFPLNVLTNWGERSLAVSDDIKKYLIDNYNISEKNIDITINGIDTDKFTPHADYTNIANEFNFAANAFRIVYISRMDKSRSLAAHHLIKISENLLKAKPNLEIVIVGGGDDFEQIKKEGEAINRKTGKRIIIFTNSRVDINSFLASANVFVGVSRSCLEAMAAFKPVVVTGNEGHIGVFNEGKLKIAIDTNFCCRGCEMVTSERLERDLLEMLQMTEVQLENLGIFGNEVIKKYYSLDIMAQDALDFYEKVRVSNKPIDVMISGYYGFNNNGDETVLKSIVEDLKEAKPNINIVVLSKNPKFTEKTHGVKSIYRFNYINIVRHLKNTNLLITGGGTLLQDLTSTQSLIYYLWIIRAGHKRGAKLMLYANGIGPLRFEVNIRRMKHALQKISMITLRDEKSLEILENFEIKSSTQVHVTADAAFALKALSQEKMSTLLMELDIHDKDYFVVAIRSWKYLEKNFEQTIADFADYINEKHKLVPIFVAMQPENDFEISKKITTIMKTKGILLDGDFSTDQLISIINQSRFVLAMRLHTIIYAAKVGTPCIGLVYDPKVQVMMDMVGQETYMGVEKMDLAKLQNFAEHVLENNNEISNDMLKNTAVIQERSEKNIKYAMELLNKGEF